jgi:hypothetical protein
MAPSCIQNVYRELSIARRRMMDAHSRLGDYLVTGTIPEDLDPNSEN